MAPNRNPRRLGLREVSDRSIPLLYGRAMIGQGLMLMAVGMGTVFAFLGLLVLFMELSARIFERLAPPPAVGVAAADDQELEIAVALAAIAAARAQQRLGR